MALPQGPTLPGHLLATAHTLSKGEGGFTTLPCHYGLLRKQKNNNMQEQKDTNLRNKIETAV